MYKYSGYKALDTPMAAPRKYPVYTNDSQINTLHLNQYLMEFLRRFNIDAKTGTIKLRAMLAGGALRSAVKETEPIKDYDIFFVDDAAAVDFAFLIKKEPTYDAWALVEKDSVEDYLHASADFLVEDVTVFNTHVQLITGNYYETMRDCIEDFDMCCCAAATDGFGVYAHSLFVNDVTYKMITLLNVNRPVSMFYRLQRYVRYGYSLTPDTIIQYLHKSQSFVDQYYRGLETAK